LLHNLTHHQRAADPFNQPLTSGSVLLPQSTSFLSCMFIISFSLASLAQIISATDGQGLCCVYSACVNPHQPTNISFRHFSPSNPTRFHTASAPGCRVFITITSLSQPFRELPLIYDLNTTTRLVYHTAFPVQEFTCIPFLPLYISSMVQRKLRKGNIFRGITGLGGMRGHFLISLMDVSQPLNRFMGGNWFVFFTSFLDQS
jgi:hypothetical protein